MSANKQAEARIFRDRREAGRLLAETLLPHRLGKGVVVLGLPRGGVPVAYEIARRLKAPLDIFSVRKLGVPGHEELAFGAVGSGGMCYLNTSLIRSLHIPQNLIREIIAREKRELERRELLYREDRRQPALQGKIVLLVDDGLATGASMRAAAAAIRPHDPARVIIMVPVAPAATCEELRAEADELICDQTPDPFNAVGLYYQDFSQVTDQEVRSLLRRHAARHFT